jgi:hypothetical protein
MKIAASNLSGPYWFAAFGIPHIIQYAIVYDFEHGFGSSGLRWLRHVFEPFSGGWMVHILLPFVVLAMTGVLWPRKMVYVWPVVIVAAYFLLRSNIVLIET